MSKSSNIATVFTFAVVCAALSFGMWKEAKAIQGLVPAIAVPDAECKQDFCTNLNWAGVPARDAAGNPIPGNPICVLFLGQWRSLCVSSSITCNATASVIPICSGNYILPGTMPAVVATSSYAGYTC